MAISCSVVISRFEEIYDFLANRVVYKLSECNCSKCKGKKMIPFNHTGMLNLSDAHFFTEEKAGSMLFSRSSKRCCWSLIRAEICFVPSEGIERSEYKSREAILSSFEIVSLTWWFAFIGEYTIVLSKLTAETLACQGINIAPDSGPMFRLVVHDINFW